MGLKQFSQNVAVRAQVAPATIAAATTVGTGIDLRAITNFAQGAKAVVYVGAATGTPDAFTVDAKIEDSANNSQWATATDAEGNNYAMTQMSAGGIGVIDNIDVGRLRQYVRLSVTHAFTGGTSPKLGLAGVLLLGNSQEIPIS